MSRIDCLNELTVPKLKLILTLQTTSEPVTIAVLLDQISAECASSAVRTVAMYVQNREKPVNKVTGGPLNTAHALDGYRWHALVL